MAYRQDIRASDLDHRRHVRRLPQTELKGPSSRPPSKKMQEPDQQTEETRSQSLQAFRTIVTMFQSDRKDENFAASLIPADKKKELQLLDALAAMAEANYLNMREMTLPPSHSTSLLYAMKRCSFEWIIVLLKPCSSS